MFSRRFHRYSQMFLRKLKSVLIRVICGRIPFKQDMNVLPQISQIFTDILEKTKICVNPRNLWEIFCMQTMQTVGATASYIQKRL